MIANKDFVLSKLNELTTYAKKNFGQNFLIDDNICQKIVKSLEVQDDNKVIEIGPGLGALSYHLSSYSDVTLYDIDEDMVNHLNSYFKFNNNIKVIKEDFLKVCEHVFKIKETNFYKTCSYCYYIEIIFKDGSSKEYTLYDDLTSSGMGELKDAILNALPVNCDVYPSCIK